MIAIASPAFAAPPNPTITSPESDIEVEWGTLTTISGIDKTAGTEILINDVFSSDACTVPIDTADVGLWSCTRAAPETNVGPHDYFVKQRLGGEDSNPVGVAYSVMDPVFKFTSSPNTQIGQPIVVGGIYDAPLPGVELQNVSLIGFNDNNVEKVTTDCTLTAPTFSCTFPPGGFPPGPYYVRATQNSPLYGGVARIKETPQFTVTPAPIVIQPPNNSNPPSSSSPNPLPPDVSPVAAPPVIDPPQVDPPVIVPPVVEPTEVDPPAQDEPAKKPHKESNDLDRLLALGIMAMTVLMMGGARGLSRVANSRKAGEAAGISGLAGVAALMNDRDDSAVEREIELEERTGRGDRSFTWRFPWHAPIDASSVMLPVAVSPRTPFVGRLLADGSEFRAILGTLWLLVIGMGAALGIVAAVDTSGSAVPPALWIVIAIVVISGFDALAGAAATLTFTASILATGSFWDQPLPDTKHSLLFVLVLGFLWTSLPLIGSAIRPFRRLGKPGVAYTWDRLADAVIAALLCGWVAQKLVGGMDLFAGVPTPIIEHADAVALVVMGAIAARVGVEQLTLAWYPARLRAVDVEGSLPEGTRFADLVGTALRVGVFGFIGYAFIGLCWQWWVGMALFALPEVVGLLRQPFGQSKVMRTLVPKGIVEILVLVVACTLAVRFAVGSEEGDLATLKLAFMVLAVPPAALGLLRLAADDDEKVLGRSWGREFLGLLVLVLTVWLVLQGWDG